MVSFVWMHQYTWIVHRLIIATCQNEQKPLGMLLLLVFFSLFIVYVHVTKWQSLFYLVIRISLITNRIVINQSRRELNVCVVKRGNWISGVFFIIIVNVIFIPFEMRISLKWDIFIALYLDMFLFFFKWTSVDSHSNLWYAQVLYLFFLACLWKKKSSTIGLVTFIMIRKPLFA